MASSIILAHIFFTLSLWIFLIKKWKSQLYNTILYNYQIIAQAQLRRDLQPPPGGAAPWTPARGLEDKWNDPFS